MQGVFSRGFVPEGSPKGFVKGCSPRGGSPQGLGKVVVVGVVVVDVVAAIAVVVFGWLGFCVFGWLVCSLGSDS